MVGSGPTLFSPVPRYEAMGDDHGPMAPNEAFRLLGDETRVAILRAVWEASETPLSFTDIRHRIGGPDSGQFNYHIDKLRGHFLRSTDDGYELTQAGREVVRAVLAGTLSDRPETEPVPIDADCVECGGLLVARYDEYGIIECDDCDTTVMWNEFPPAGLDGRDGTEFARVFDRWTQRRFRLAMDGICPSCAGGMETRRVGNEADGEPDVASHHRCSNCGYEARVPLFGHILDHPAVISFYHERGLDVTDQPYWHLESMARDFTETILDEDPWRAAVEIEADGDRLSLTLDERFDVVDVELTTE